MDTNNIRSEDCIAKPIFIGEVNLYLKERFKILDIENGQKVDNDSVQKVINYSFFKSFVFLKKEKVAKLRKYIDEQTDEINGKNENKFQTEMILCKIIDLKPKKFFMATKLFPEYKKYFSLNSFRRHYTMINSILNEK